MKRTQASRTPEQKKESGGRLSQVGRTPEMRSNAVKKQWETIKGDSDKLKEVCAARVVRMEKVWENYSETQKNKIVFALCAAHGKSRSTSSDLLKQKMQVSGVYDGFVSEEVFHGFVPDEINHDLKIIVEMYGDLYHCNPRKYKEPTQYLTAIQRTVEEQWTRDRRRLACFYKHGYTVIVVWDSDFRRYPEREIGRIRDEVDKKRNAHNQV